MWHPHPIAKWADQDPERGMGPVKYLLEHVLVPLLVRLGWNKPEEEDQEPDTPTATDSDSRKKSISALLRDEEAALLTRADCADGQPMLSMEVTTSRGVLKYMVRGSGQGTW